jgi:hypothetical protein
LRDEMADGDERLIRRYYDCFNTRRFTDGAALVGTDCEFDHRPTRDHARGPRGYRVLVDDWLRAAPDVVLIPEHITAVEDGVFRVMLRARGHLDGQFSVGPVAVGGDGRAFDFVGTHDVTVRDGQIVLSRFTYNREDFFGPSPAH